MWGFTTYVLCGTALQSPLNIAGNRTVAPRPLHRYAAIFLLKQTACPLGHAVFRFYGAYALTNPAKRCPTKIPGARYQGDFFSKAIAINQKKDKPLICVLVRFNCFRICCRCAWPPILPAPRPALPRARFSGGVPGFRIGRACRNPRPQGKPYGGSAQ